MSPPPQGVGPVPSPGRSDTKNSDRPSTGVGQKSADALLMGAPRLRGVLQGESRLARSAAQMSLPPAVPGRFDAMSRLRPSALSIGQPSPKPGTLTSLTSVAVLNSGFEVSGRPPALAVAVRTASSAPASRVRLRKLKGSIHVNPRAVMQSKRSVRQAPEPLPRCRCAKLFLTPICTVPTP
jgi:hypothetical protein